jgi:hypothetical protein
MAEVVVSVSPVVVEVEAKAPPPLGMFRAWAIAIAEAAFPPKVVDRVVMVEKAVEEELRPNKRMRPMTEALEKMAIIAV